MTENIQNAFSQLLTPATEEDKYALKGQVLALKFLSEIDEAMASRKMKKKELAKKVGTSASYITQLFMGDRKPNWEILAKMADALDIDFYVTTKEKHLQQRYSPRGDQYGMWVYKKHVENAQADYPEVDANSDMTALAV